MDEISFKKDGYKFFEHIINKMLNCKGSVLVHSAAIANENGAILIVGIFFFLIMFLIRLSSKANDSIGFLYIFGVISMILFQVVVNVGMNIGILPITGITLPLVSYGGSSVVATLISLGIVSSISKYSKKIQEWNWHNKAKRLKYQSCWIF